MKIKKDHYKELVSIITKYTKKYNINLAEWRLKYQKEKIGKDPAVRFRWDVLWRASEMDNGHTFFKHVYSYANDSHIDTALIKAIKEVSEAQDV